MQRFLLLTAACALGGTAMAQQGAPVDPVDNFGVAPLMVTNIGARATTACDDFNRATGLGADWAAVASAPTIVNDRFAGSGNTSAQHTSASVSYDAAVISFDLPDTPGVLTYGAAVHGLGGSDNLFTKVQCQSPYGAYNYVGFYHLAGSSGGGLGGFQAIPAPITGGIITCYVTGGGDIMNIDMDTDRDGVVDQSMTAGGCLGLAPLMGNAVGIGCYGNNAGLGAADDWELNGGCGPVGPSLALVGSCPGAIGVDIGGMTAGGNVAIVAGVAGAFSVPAGRPCAGTAIGVNPLAIPQGPIYFVVPADANGEVNIGAVGNAGPAACGLISVVAIDLASCAVSNVAAL